MDVPFPRFLPKIIEHCLVIPLITLMLTYGVYILVAGSVFGVVFLGYERIIMIDPILMKECLGIGIVVLMVAVLFVFGFLDRLGKQRTQAKDIEVRMSYGYEPTVQERLDMEKVKNVNKIFTIALVFGIIVASVLGVLGVHFVLMDKIGSDSVFYFASFAFAFIDYLLVDYVVSAVAKGEFEKVKQKILEEFRKVEQVENPTALNDAVSELQMQFASLSTAMQNIANAVRKQ